MVKAVDHMVVLVRDLEVSAAVYKRLGFHVRPIAHHIGVGSANAIIHFPETYLELVHTSDARADLRDMYMPRLEDGEGLCHISLTSNDLEADVARLSGHGHSPGTPMMFARDVVMPDGRPDKTASSSVYNWQAERRYMSLFFSEHPKPETIFIPAYCDHANGAEKLTALAFMSRDPAGDLPYFEASFGGRADTVNADGFQLTGARGEVVSVLTSQAAQVLYGDLLGRAEPAATGGYPIAMHFSVTDPAAPRRALEAAGIGFSDALGGVAVAAAEAAGAILVFETD